MHGLARLDNPGPDGERLRAQLSMQLPSGSEHYRLGMDLGFAYARGVVIPEGTPKPEPADPVQEYRPTTWPGCRLPHFWVSCAGETRASIHDRLPREAFILLTHPAGQPEWQAAVEAVAAESRLPLLCRSIGPAAEADWADDEQAWERLSEVEPTGAVLVRPDGHVAWRAAQLPAAPADTLRSIFHQLLPGTEIDALVQTAGTAV
jgi:2,4-dichlorophenol 6-monooxygenase